MLHAESEQRNEESQPTTECPECKRRNRITRWSGQNAKGYRIKKIKVK
jgi:hypothetical protein